MRCLVLIANLNSLEGRKVLKYARIKPQVLRLVDKKEASRSPNVKRYHGSQR